MKGLGWKISFILHKNIHLIWLFHHLFETETWHGEHHRFVELSILWAVEGAAGCTWFIFQWLAAPHVHRRIFGLLGPDKPVAWKSLGGLESCSFNKSFTKRLNSIRIASVVAYPLDLLGLVQAFNMFSLFVVCIPHREAVGFLGVADEVEFPGKKSWVLCWTCGHHEKPGTFWWGLAVYDDVYDEGCKHLSLEGISQELVFRLYAVAECCGDWARLVSFGLRRETLLTLSFKVYDMFSWYVVCQFQLQVKTMNSGIIKLVASVRWSAEQTAEQTIGPIGAGSLCILGRIAAIFTRTPQHEALGFAFKLGMEASCS